MTTLIMKFGGLSVGTPPALTQVLSIVLHEQKRWDQLVLVASALDGVTDSLLEAAYLAQVSNQRGYRRIAATLRTRHMALIEQLPFGAAERTALQADIDRLLFDMLDVCQTVASAHADRLLPAISDSISSVGERLSARIIASLLRQNGLLSVALDGFDVLVTDSTHGNATPLLPETNTRIQQNLLPMLTRGIVPVVTGFIGADAEGRPTTIGRGGSDYTASILAICTQADEVWIWSGVDGMMSADPHEIDNAQVIPELSYAEVAELAYFGARILHARMIAPLREHHIPLRIKNVFKPQLAGSLIHELVDDGMARIKAVTSIQGIGLTAERSGSLAEIIKLVDDTLFATVGTRADVMISSQSSSSSFVCFIVPTSVGSDSIETIQMLLPQKLEGLHEPASWQIRPLAIVTAVGRHLDESMDVLADIFSHLSGTRLLGITQGPSHCSLSVIVEVHEADITVQRIHRLAIRNG